MNNKTGFNPLSRRVGHRKALIKNMVTSLLKYERITTTKAKAKEVRRYAEKMVTRAKEDSVHNRREIAKTITDKAVLAKLFTEIGPRFVKRPGGYTRIMKLGRRFGDAAEMVLLEFVEKNDQAPEAAKPAKAAAAKPAKTVEKAEKAEATTAKKPAKAKAEAK